MCLELSLSDKKLRIKRQPRTSQNLQKWNEKVLKSAFFVA